MKFHFVTVLISLFVVASTAHAMTSTNYTIDWDAINSGGIDSSSSTNYELRDSIGEQSTGISSSTNYEIRAGYRQGVTDEPLLTFEFGTQEDATQTSFSSFSTGPTTVTVSATSSFSVGNFIGVIENEGLSQLTAIGKITGISGAVITVDEWQGQQASISASPAGGNDFVYRLEGGTAALGNLSVSAGETSLTHTSITTNAGSGYTAYVHTNGNLRTTSNDTIDAVSDGAVSIGSEEYGVQVFGSKATSTGSDLGLTTSNTAIQESTSSANDERIALVYKVSISASTVGGSYTQEVFYTVTGNF